MRSYCDLHANNIVLNKASGSLYMIDFRRSVIQPEGVGQSQLILDDLELLTDISSTPASVRQWG
jgi:hypothetical protein